MVSEIALPTREELLKQDPETLRRYRGAVTRELRRARKRRPCLSRPGRSLQARILADAILESLLAEHIKLVGEVLAAR